MDSLQRFLNQNVYRSNDGRYFDVEQYNYNDQSHKFMYRVSFWNGRTKTIVEVEAKSEQGAANKVAEMLRKEARK